MEIYVKKVFFSGFQSWFFFHLHWFYRYRSFNRSNWCRHKLGHIEHLIQALTTLVLILYSKLTKKPLRHWRFLIRF